MAPNIIVIGEKRLWPRKSIDRINLGPNFYFK